MRFRHRTCLLAAGAALLLGAAPARALKFEAVNPKDLPSGVRSALWVRDCGRAFGDKQCGEDETGFSVGDSVRLARELSARRYDEVWLASNGGVLDEGLAVGEVLRRFQATVRVPPGRQCISSCTVAFLGGVFRYIDQGATYQVHAASLFLDTDLNDPWMKEVLEDPRGGLVEWADRLLDGFDLRRSHISGSRESAQQLLLHFQKALHPLGQLPPGREDANRDQLRKWVLERSASAYGGSAQLAQDVAQVQREGVAAVQQILMRLERDSMQQAIQELRPMLPSLGPRAEPALRMLETMYTSRITGTATLSYETLLQMGYITKVFESIQAVIAMMRTRYLRRMAAAGAVATLMSSSLASAQDKDTLWTKVAAEGRIISLAWDKDHPWDAALSTGGAELIARYFVDARREVTESLGRGVARNGDRRTLRFPLPESVRNPSVGPVCLFLQLPDRRVLPIRRANDRDSDTVGFRYEAWERQVREASDARIAQEQVALAQRALNLSSQSITAKQSSLTQRGWKDLSSCEQIAAPTATVGPRPYDVVAPADQDAAARRVCVNRVAVGYLINADFISDTLPKLLATAAASQDAEKARGLMSEVYSSAFSGPPGMNPASLLTAIVNKLGADNATVRARQTQGTEFLRDWAKWTPTLKDYTPEVGSPTDDVGWPSTATESAFHLFGPELASQLKTEWAMQGVPAGTARDLESYLGAALDAYSGCVEDSSKQLKTKYDSWEALRSSAPQRAASAREFLVRECRQEVAAFDSMQAERTKLQDQLVRAQQTLTAASAPIAFPTNAQPLNSVSCAAKR